MPIGLVNDNEFELEKDRLNSVPLVNSRVVDPKTIGRGNGNNAVPDSLRNIIGETSSIDGRKDAIQLASMFGVSPSAVSAYGNGATSTASYNKPNSDLKNHIQKSKDRIAVRARGKLRLALDNITDDKLKSAKVADIASVAKSMSSVMRDMEPPPSNNDLPTNRPQIVIYAPQMRREESFEVIQVNE